MNHFGYHDSAARSGTAEPRRSRRSPLCLLPRAGNTRPPAQNHPRCAGPAAQDAAGAPRGHRGPRHRAGTATTLQQPQRRLMSHSVINAQRLFRCAGSVLNIHAKERKHAECKCLRSSKLRGHIYILIVENYKAKRAGRRLRGLLGQTPALCFPAMEAEGTGEVGQRSTAQRQPPGPALARALTGNAASL